MELVAVKSKYQVVIPHKLRRSIKIKVGDYMEAKLDRGSVVLTPKKVVDYSDFPNTNDEYTPQQRKQLDVELTEAVADYKAGRAYGPFNTVKEMIASMKSGIKTKSKKQSVSKK